MTQTVTRTSTYLPWWKQLRTWLILLVVALVLVPVLIQIGTVLPRTYSQDVEQILNQLDAVAGVKNDQIISWLGEGHRGLSFLLSDDIRREQAIRLIDTLDEELEQEYNEFLASYQASTITFDSLILYNIDGLILAGSNPIDVGKRVNRQPFYNGSINNAAYIQPPYYAVNSNELATFVSSQITDETGALLGIMGGTLRIETLNNIMLTNSTGYAESGESLLVSQQTNYFLTPSRFEGYSQNQAYTSEGIEDGLQGNSGGGLYDDYRNPPVPVVSSYRYIPELEAVLIVKVDQAEALAITFSTINAIALIAGLSAIIAIVIGYRFASRIAAPLVQLTRAAIAVTEGDYSQRVETNSQNEIGQLSNAFNVMTSELETNINNLEILNEELEQRVEERTRDLNIAAQVSQQVTRVLDMNQLLPDLANLTRNGFELEHVSVFVYDKQSNSLVLQAGSGEVGTIMLEEGKHFNISDQGLVPLAARTGEAQIINDVYASPDHFVNPLLPNTRSEMTIPMRVGGNLIGVMDLQSNEIDHFTKEIENVLVALAEQIAIAIQNADLYQQAELARQAAEKSDTVKSQFLASMSHELRTPLNGIMNFTGVVADGMIGPVNEKQQKFLRDAVSNAEHLLALINDVLDISKIESGALKLFVTEDIDVGEIVTTVARTGETLVLDKPVKVITEIDDNLPLIVGDKRRIQQILLNIVSNACKFTKEGGITIGVKQQNDDLLMWVTDSGPGIAPEDHNSVFETFLQTETGLRSGSGTGLGMPISRKLAEAHGGQLWLESTVGEGTTFYVTLPIQSKELKMQVAH